MKISENIASATVKSGSVAVFSMGQTGFVFKLPDGTAIALDLYLSDCCERYFGFKRIMPKIMSADEYTFDYVVASHAHYDHFDPDSVPTLLSNPNTKMLAACDVKVEAERLSLRKDQITYLKVGDSFDGENFKLTAVPCDHGELAPDALGLVLEAEGKKIYVMGDTCFRADLLENDFIKNCDLLILPINGAFGNLNSEEAAKVVSILKPKLAVPCHYWNFAEHGGDPNAFATIMKEKYPEQKYFLMQMGEKMYI